MSHRKNPGSDRPAPSVAVGGPGTGSGLNYQVDFAVRQALEAMSQALANPIEDLQISMEPRVLAGNRQATCWDLRLSHPERVTEVKLKPRRVDILEWLDRIELATKQNVTCRFELSYGRGATPLLSAIETLCLIAIESDGDIDRFRSLCTLESKKAIAIVLDHLTTAPHVSLSRLTVTPIDTESLQREIRFLLRCLVRESDALRLNDLLSAKFHKGIEQRATYHVHHLLQEARDAKIEFFSPPPSLPLHLAPAVSSAIHVLQYCETGLPTQVLAAAINCTDRDVNESLSKHVGAAGLSVDEECWRIGPITPPVAHENSVRLLTGALRQLLEFITRHKKSDLGRRQIGNAIALAKLCQTEDSELVSTVFPALDKLLKRTGNKRLVLEVANLSLAAARRLPSTEKKTRAEAATLICGRAWVFQRINRLPEARADGEKSLQLGQDIDWYRNTAFCLKCLGRLYRMEAEQQRAKPAQFGQLLDLSVSYLKRAIDTFPAVTELSESERLAEVGDCESLLGRAYFVAGDLKKAEAAARDAIGRISDTGSKDYADLQILLGDLAKAQGNTDAAVSFYNDAIEAAGRNGAEGSEIAARAYLQKGHATGSKGWFDLAAKIWAELEEEDPADEARWCGMEQEGRIPAVAGRVLEEESASVRVETIRLHEEALGTLAPSRGRRSEPGREYWKELLPDARKNVAVRRVEW